jgi:hypothetical protein
MGAKALSPTAHTTASHLLQFSTCAPPLKTSSSTWGSHLPDRYLDTLCHIGRWKRTEATYDYDASAGNIKVSHTYKDAVHLEAARWYDETQAGEAQAVPLSQQPPWRQVHTSLLFVETDLDWDRSLCSHYDHQCVCRGGSSSLVVVRCSCLFPRRTS